LDVVSSCAPDLCFSGGASSNELLNGTEAGAEEEDSGEREKERLSPCQCAVGLPTALPEKALPEVYSCLTSIASLFSHFS
jgi:hypothetical protein